MPRSRPTRRCRATPEHVAQALDATYRRSIEGVSTMNMKIGGLGTPPLQPEQIGEAQRAGKAGAPASGPALTVDPALVGAQQGAGGPLGIEDILPAPDYGAQQRVLLGSSGTSGVDGTQDAAGAQQSQGSDLAAKIDPNTADSNAAVVAMMAAGLAMIQAQQTAAKAEDTERKSDLHSYEDKMDSA